MGDYFLEVSSGSGTRLAHYEYTVGVDTVADQKVRVGLPFLPTYSLSVVTPISMATLDAHLLQMMAGANNRLTLVYLRVTQVAVASAAAVKGFGLYRLTTAGSGGTAVSPRKLNPASGNAEATAMTLPTVKGTEGELVVADSGAAFAAVPSTGILPAIVKWDWRGALRSEAPEIAAGTSNGLALKLLTSDGGTPTVRIYAEFFERSYT